jgi:Acetyltransferase (GNAT) domain
MLPIPGQGNQPYAKQIKAITMMFKVGKFRKTIKQRIKKLCRRLFRILFNASQLLQLRACSLARFIPKRPRQSLARIFGDLAFLMFDLTKKDVWQMSGSGLRIVFVGERIRSRELMPVLFNEAASHEHIGQTWTLGLSRKTAQWLDNGCDLVICELSRMHWFRSSAPVTFTVPQLINQVLTYPEKMNTLLSGNRHGSLRQHINRVRRAGYEWRFSRSRDDFDFFYERMYVPFMRARHGELAEISRYPQQWELFVQKAGGGLVLVTHAGRSVAGVVGLVVDGVCYNMEVGLLDADEALLRQGVNIFLFWALAEWGKAQGARFYNMGGSLGWLSDGGFRWKAKWGARTIRNWYPNPTFTFSAARMSPALRDQINHIGFVSECKGRYYQLALNTEGAPPAGSELEGAIERAKKYGLSGVCMVAPSTQMHRYE